MQNYISQSLMKPDYHISSCRNSN